MQIIIPMSGFGERFRRVGYTLPKPLIPVDGKPIIAHVIDLFPGETDFVFICNEDHLANPDYKMAQTLRKYCPTGKIVPIGAHKLGPVNAVRMARDHIKRDVPVIVNYCDFTCYWDYHDFKKFVVQTDCVGAIPAYTGFHPHSLGSTFYAYVKHDGLWVSDIQEKKPWTDKPMSEYASSGTYYFKSGAICLNAFDRQVEQNLEIGDEFYASLAYQILLQERAPIAIYHIEHFMQWGTPADLKEYQNWSKTFRRLMTSANTYSRHDGTVLVPMAGLGSRFADEGFELPKPLIPVSGRAMVLQAVRDLPNAPHYRFVTRKDLPHLEDTNRTLRSSFLDVSIKILEGPTEGQLITCLEGLENIDLDAPLTIGACDNGMLYNEVEFEALMSNDDIDIIVWTVRGHPDGAARPEMFGWVGENNMGKINQVSVKTPMGNPETDAMITGTFTFRFAKDFVRIAESFLKRDQRINNEYYVDSIIEDAVQLGLDCRTFDIDAYIGWGTPKDLAIFEYWQSCFHKWNNHPYRLEKDNRIPASKLNNLLKKTSPKKALRPENVKKESDTLTFKANSLNEASAQVLRFIPIGIGAVLVDLIFYFLLLFMGLPITASKTISFCLGVVFSYFGNKHFTFKRQEDGLNGKALFILIYALSLLANIGANFATLKYVLPVSELRFIAAFIVATGISAGMNFFGMKLFVFKGDKI
jgi:NDP-sugar pyrophosphorylase family protein/putative flippase GtrA